MAFSGAFVKPFRPAFDAGGATAGNGLLNNLVAYWPLNEAAGANNALDLHTNGLTLTQAASPGSAAGVVYAGARTFNGSSQYFNRASEALLQTGDIDFTIAAWIYLLTGADAAQRPIVNKWSETGEYTLRFTSDGPGKVFRWVVGNGSGTIGQINSIAVATVNSWTLIIANHSALLNAVSVQINNGNIDSAATTGAAASTDRQFELGKWLANSWYFSGRIGPVAMWKSAAGGGGVLTAAQRSSLYNSGAGLAYSAFTT